MDAVVRPGSAASACSASAVAELVERRALPGVDLAVVLGQLDREAAVDEPAERAAGLELGQLAVVADEHQLAADRRDVRRAARASCRVGTMPASSTTSTHRSRQRAERVAQVAEQRGDARAADAGAVLELARGAPRDGHAEHRMPGGLPRLARGAERERLAGPGLADHHARPRRRRGRAARPSAAARPTASAAPRPQPATGRSPRDAGARCARGGDLVDEPLLEREQLRGRVDAARRVDRQQPPIAPPERLALASRAGSSATACGEARNRSAAASIARASTRAPAGSRSHSAWTTSRRENVDARCVSPVGEASSAKIRCHVRVVERAAAWTRPSSRSSSSWSKPSSAARVPPLRDQLIDRERRRPSACRVASAAASAARGPDVPRSRQRRLDLRAPAAERPQHRLRHADDLGDPVADRRPLDPERPGQLRAQHRLVDEARRPRVRVQPPAIQRRPAPVRPTAEVRDQDVRVQLRITRARRAVPERRRHQPGGRLDHQRRHGRAGPPPPSAPR